MKIDRVGEGSGETRNRARNQRKRIFSPSLRIFPRRIDAVLFAAASEEKYGNIRTYASLITAYRGALFYIWHFLVRIIRIAKEWKPDPCLDGVRVSAFPRVCFYYLFDLNQVAK